MAISSLSLRVRPRAEGAELHICVVHLYFLVLVIFSTHNITKKE